MTGYSFPGFPPGPPRQHPADMGQPLTGYAVGPPRAPHGLAGMPRVGFANGCFDLFHAGHALFLGACRRRCDWLIVGLNTDESIGRLKGRAPVYSLRERTLLLESCRHVGEVRPFAGNTPEALILALRPAVLFKGADYAGREVDGAAAVRSWGGSVEIIDTPRVGTTEIITRIKAMP